MADSRPLGLGIPSLGSKSGRWTKQMDVAHGRLAWHPLAWPPKGQHPRDDAAAIETPCRQIYSSMQPRHPRVLTMARVGLATCIQRHASSYVAGHFRSSGSGSIRRLLPKGPPHVPLPGSSNWAFHMTWCNVVSLTGNLQTTQTELGYPFMYLSIQRAWFTIFAWVSEGSFGTITCYIGELSRPP